MNDFARCIEYLLLNHDCVVVPGMGAFIAQHQEARIDTSEEVMLPPYRLVRFNAAIQQQDGMLRAAVQDIYGIGSNEADQKICTWFTELQQTLEDCDGADFGSIGTFNWENGQLTFIPTEAGITTPEFYALDAFHLQEIQQEERNRTPMLQTTGKDITIRINRSVANYVAAACAAIVLFLSFSTPVRNTETVTFEQKSSSELFLPAHLLYAPLPEQAAEVPTAKRIEAIKKPSIRPDSTPKTTEDQRIDAHYCIVVASAVTRTNGSKYVESLQTQGHKTARLLEKGKVTRVVLGAYKTKEEAQEAARELRNQNKEFEQAWVYSL